MSTCLSQQPDCVAVTIDGDLGYEHWQTLRDAREMAARDNLPLRIELQNCAKMQRIGLGAIMLAQEKLGSVELKGCQGWLRHAFYAFGVCDQCGRRGSEANCPANSTSSASPAAICGRRAPTTALT